MIEKADAAKAALPVSVAGSELLGLSLPEWVLVATLIYTVLQIYLLLRRVFTTAGDMACTNDNCPGRQVK